MATGDSDPLNQGTPSSSEVRPMLHATDQSLEGMGSDRIPLPPISAVPTSSAALPESFLARLRFLDAVIVLLVLTFAFLCASFRASNSDLFQHLATGRLLFNSFSFGGPDPFTFTVEGTWINNSWCFDILTYLIYTSSEEFGGSLLVMLKATLVVITGWLMIRSATPEGQRSWVPAVLVALALLVMSPRLLLQPTILSMLFLATTFCLLRASASQPGKIWLLPILCLVWVNFDGWFLLGPLTVLLHLIGETIQQEKSNHTLTTKLGVIVACIACCLINPYHYNVFLALPAGILHTGPMAILKDEGAFRGYFVSPFQSVYFSPYFGLSASGISYFVLLGLGGISFILTAILNQPGLRWSRILLFLATALLSGWSVRAIPFFAVLAGPITALNFLDLASHLNPQGALSPGSRRWAVSGRFFTTVVLVLLAAVTFPGWLQSLPHYRRQVAWGVEVEPALRDACRTISRWRAEGLITEGNHWFNTSPDAAYYFAWFAPGEKCFLDGRMQLYPRAAAEYRTIRRSLTGEGPGSEDLGEDGAPLPAWRKVFEDRQVQFVVFHSIDLARSSAAMAALSRMFSNPVEFIPCFNEGNTALFVWGLSSSGLPRETSDRLRENFASQAFGKNPVQAPSEPARAAGERSVWDRILQTELSSPPGSLTALQHTIRFDARSMAFQIENSRTWVSAQGTSLVGLAAAQGGPLASGILLPLRLQEGYTGQGRAVFDAAARELMSSFLRTQDSGPVSDLYLAVRNARQALTENPDDTIAQLFLAEAYTRLTYRTKERSRISIQSAGRNMTFFLHAQLVRQAQIAASLQNVLKVAARPEQLRAAHQLLIEAFAEPEYFEVRVHHLREYIKLARVIGGPPGIPPSQFGEYLKNVEGTLKEMTTQLKNRRDQYEVNAANKPLLEKARIALETGLCETAYNLLMRADPKDLRDRRNPREAPGVSLLASIMLGLGRVDEVRDLLMPDPQKQTSSETSGFGTHPLGLPALEWMQAQYGAAIGDYKLADEGLSRCLEQQRLSPSYTAVLMAVDLASINQADKPTDAPTAAALIVGHVLLTEAQTASGLPWQIKRYLPVRSNAPYLPKEPGPVVTTRQGAQLLWRLLEQRADVLTLRAWIALEAGRLDEARQFSQQSIDLAKTTDDDGKPAITGFRSRPLAELVLELAENRKPRD